MTGISEQRREGEKLHVRMLVGNDGDGIEEEGIERGRLRWSIRSGQLVIFYGSPLESMVEVDMSER